MFWWRGGGGKPKMSYDVLCRENRYTSAMKIDIRVAPYRNPAFTHGDEDGNWSLLKHKMWVKPAFLKYSRSILRSVNVVYYDFSKQRWIIRRCSSLLLVPPVIALFKHYIFVNGPTKCLWKEVAPLVFSSLQLISFSLKVNLLFTFGYLSRSLLTN